MRIKILTLLILLTNTAVNTIFAQVSAYPFSQLSTTYTAITGGQVLGSTTSDDQVFVDPAAPAGVASGATGVGLPIGFNFTYNGRTYDRFAVNTNGWIVLGQSTSTPAVNTNSSSGYTPISSTSTAPAALQNRIAGFARDLQGQTGSTLRYQTIGTAPNRVLVVQWSNFRRFAGTGEVFNFQIRLNELGGIVQVVYGTCTATSTTNYTVQVGLRGDANTDFNNRNVPTTGNWATSTAGATNAATCNYRNNLQPISGLTFQWGLLVNDDAGISALLNPTAPLTPGLQPVNVSINNFGNNVINSANIEWSVAGVLQTPVPFTGPLAAGGNTSVSLGNFNFPPNPTLYRFWTSQPNGVNDPRNNNDTFQITLCGALAAGTYTVGSPTSDFPTISDMMTALYSCGISGPVTMNLQPGLYSGAVRFAGPIIGASATNRVVINGTGTDVTVLTHDGTGTNGNATLALDGANFVTIQNLTIRNTGTTLAWGALLINNASNNRLLNNKIEMFYNPGVISVYGIAIQAAYAAAGTEGNNGSFNIIQGNIISGGDMGIRIEAATATRNTYNRVLNNIISNVDDYGIYADDQDSLEIIGNRVENLLSTNNYGMYLTDARSYNISNNFVSAGDYGIYCLNMGTSGNVTVRNRIFNNMVQFVDIYGFYFSGVRASDFYHNTINGVGTSPTSVASYILTPNDVNIKNNIFANETGYVFRSSVASPFASMNNNLFYQNIPNPNSNYIAFGTTLFSDFTQWQTNTFGHGANDVSGNPVFFSSTDLHVDGILANDAGDNSVAITTDIDGESRPFTGSTTVDIGADEYKPKDNDAGVINMTTPNSPLAAGFQPVTVTVKNFAVQPLTIFTVQWKYNGVQQSNFTYTGSPIAPQQTTDVVLGSINYFPGTSADMEFWTILPNSVPDERTSNDTFRIFLCPGLNGQYSVGRPTDDFPSIAEAISTLYQCGVSGPVTMTLSPGTYTGQQLALTGNIPGSSLSNTVTFDGVNPDSVTLTHDGSGNLQFATVILNEVQFITVQNMTINTTAQGVIRGHGIHLINQADNNKIIGNVINATWAPAILDKIGIVASASLSDDFAEGNTANNLLIEGNTINGGEMGIHIEGELNNPIRNISIINNRIEAYDDYGVYGDEIDSLVIESNTIISTTGSTAASGLYLFDPVYYRIQKNFILTNDWGIYLSSANNPAFGSRAIISNNMVTSRTDDALYMTTSGTVDIWHNTFASSAATTASCNGAYILAPVSGTIDIRNNIFSTTSTSTTSYAFECTVNTAQLDMDNNNFFSAGVNTIRYATTNYTFNNWRLNNVYGYDQNSLNVNPQYVNIANGDLHIQNVLLHAAADSSIVIPTDIDGDQRPSAGSTRPDIGADEIFLINNDAIAVAVVNPVSNVCENATQSVDVTVGNSGLALVTAVNVTVNVTGSLTTTLTGSYSGSLSTGQTANVNVGTINTTGGGTFCFEVIVQMVGDANTANDTFFICRNIVPATPVFSVNNACLNQSGSITTVPSGGINWYDVPAGGAVLSTSDTFVTGPLVFGTTYYAEVIACGTTRFPVNVGIIIPSPINIGNDTTICSNSTLDISAPANLASYLWSTGQTTQTITVQNASLYSLTVTDANGCRIVDTKDVLNFSNVTLSSSSNSLTCGNAGAGFIDLTVNGSTAPYAYLWSNGATIEDITGLNTGSYDVSVTDINGCLFTETYTVNGPTSLSFNSINTSSPSCGILVDGLIDLSVSGGVAPYSYLWSTGATTEDLNGVANGSYSVTVTDANGCQTNITTNMNIVSTVQITVDNVQDEAVQLGGAIDVSVSGGQAPYYFLWNTGLTSASISGLVAGTYTVTVTDINGCSSVQTVVVNYAIPSLVENIDVVESLNIFPNPTSDIVNFQLSLNEETEVKLDIYAVDGKLVQSFTSNNAKVQQYSADLSDYPAGLYMARIIIGSEVVTAKIVLKK
jgi:hypothetical protein